MEGLGGARTGHGFAGIHGIELALELAIEVGLLESRQSRMVLCKEALCVTKVYVSDGVYEEKESWATRSIIYLFIYYFFISAPS